MIGWAVSEFELGHIRLQRLFILQVLCESFPAMFARKKVIWISVLIVCVGLGAVIFWPEPKEPEYKGLTLSYWVRGCPLVTGLARSEICGKRGLRLSRLAPTRFPIS